MVNERMPVIPEGTPVPPEDFYLQSAELLLSLPVTGEDENSPPVYCTMEWDESRRVTNLTLATVEPTGAARQEVWGQFHQAQFRVDERDSDGAEKGRRFVWCSTGPRSLGEPIALDEERLAREHGLIRLSERYVVAALSQRARTLDDYIQLATLMEQHGVEGTPELERNLRRLLGGIVQRGRDIPESIDKMLELTERYQSVSEVISPLIQGRLVSILLQGISVEPGLGRDNPLGTPELAAATLAEALERGVIPQEHRVVDRILSAPKVYSYPFATGLLHRHLEASRHWSHRRIFGTERLDFIHTYISRVVEASSDNTDMVRYLANARLDYRFVRNVQRQELNLQRLVNMLASLIYSEEPAADMPYATGIRSVAPVYSYVLEHMSAKPDSIVADDGLRHKSLEVVELLLDPIIRLEAGKRAVESEVSLEPDELEE